VESTSSTQLWQLSAGQLAETIRTRRASSREVVEAHLARIDAVNQHLNAITSVLMDRALAEAGEADRRLAAGDRAGPLHGVPFTIKENIDLAGSATTHGVSALAGAVASVDAPAVAHLRGAGAIPVGRTNLPDFGLRWHTDSDMHGATVNPWASSRTPGGSSGGEAVALATGMTPLGVGNDLAGSLRWPAQCNGICSIKPTTGRVPRASCTEPLDPPLSLQLMAVNGPMARRVSDLRVALEAMILPSPRDPSHIPLPLSGPPPPTPIRVAVVTDPAGAGVSPDVAAGVRRAAEALAAAGYDVDEIEPPEIALAAATFRQVLMPDVRVTWPLSAPLASADANRSMELFMELAPEIDRATYARAFMTRRALARAWSKFQAERPLIVAPVSTQPPFELGADLTLEGAAAIQHALRLVVAVNLLGLPAVAVPAGVGGGLPQAVQIIGPAFREDLCLDAAEVVEEAAGLEMPVDPR
jgi:amidase